MLIDVSKLHKVRRSTYFEALNLWKGRFGSYFHSYEGQKDGLIYFAKSVKIA